MLFSISKRDRDNLIKITCNKNVIVLPPAIELLDHRPTPINNNNLLFIGDLTWTPNRDALIWLVKKIYPLIKEKNNMIKLLIIGRYSSTLKPIKMNGVKYEGYVKNLDKYINNSPIFIVPNTYGTGIRIKILQAMSWNIPIVSTYEGANGLDVQDGKEILLAETEEDFANKVLLLINNKNLQEKLIINSRKFLQKHYLRQNITNIISNSLSNSLSKTTK